MKNILSKNTFRLLVGVIGISAITACSKNDDDVIVEGSASLKVINAVEGSSNQDLYQNNTKLASSVAYGASSSTGATATSGYSSLTFTNTGSNTSNATIDVGLSANVAYSVFYYKKPDGSMTILGYEDDNSTPPSGKARVRFINFANALAANINVTVASNASAVVSALSLRTASAYVTVDPGVNLNVSGAGAVVGDVTVISGSDIQAGKNYTIWFDNETTTKVKYHIVAQN